MNRWKNVNHFDLKIVNRIFFDDMNDDYPRDYYYDYHKLIVLIQQLLFSVLVMKCMLRHVLKEAYQTERVLNDVKVLLLFYLDSHLRMNQYDSTRRKEKVAVV